ncbi:MAG: LPS export ABC transporter permease LptF [Burkholderiales bacterium]|nr:LPS export ABC transporter permease LptF [Burkholderiales bacterium]
MPPDRLFERTLLREFAGMAAGLFFVLVTIMIVTQGAKLLGAATSGAVAAEAVSALLGLQILAYIPWLLTFAIFGTILTAMTRGWRDHEMAVWLAAGQPLTAWIRPVMTFVVPMALLIAVLSLAMTPWAKQKSREYREELATRDDISNWAPGLFKESSNGDRVYFVENFSGTGGAARNVFVRQIEQGREAITVAQEGFINTYPIDGERILVLKNGRRYEGLPGQADYRMVEFEKAEIRIEEPERQRISPATEAKSALALWTSDSTEDKAELIWRLAIPIAAVALSLLAIPLSYVNPRVGRTFNLLIAALLLSIYFNMIYVSARWISAGHLPATIGMWPLHGAVLALAWWLFRLRAKPQS